MAPIDPRSTASGNEEPELGSEESIPLDGKDVVGERMMEDLGRDRKEKAQEADPSSPPAEPMPEQFPTS